jgi:GAF domain-containing protein
MSATPDGTLADPKDHFIADLQRQLVECRAERDEALEQQTATAEVLHVINSSPGDLAPVFDAMLEKALRLCKASFGFLSRVEGEWFWNIAQRGAPSSLFEITAQPRKVVPGNVHYRLMKGEDLVHVADITTEDVYLSGNAVRQALADLGGARTVLWVALRKDNGLLGSFIVYRKEVRPFSDKQIALLQNFAAQAVIAMENARLLTETREALEQQTATAEVLQVINASPGDLAPVFDAMLEKAHSLCGIASGALQIWDGTRIRALATRGLPGTFEEIVREGYEPGPQGFHWQLLNGAPFVHVHDQSAIDEPTHRKAVDLGGFRTFLAVALRKDDVLLGRIVAARQEVRPFSNKEIALLQNFAAQAVIAMENARLLGELRQRTSDLEQSLEYQTAISDVLKVISQSSFNLQLVLDTLVVTAARLCLADQAVVFRRNADDTYALAANFGFPLAYEEYHRARGPIPVALRSGSPAVLARVASERRVIHIEDIATVPGYPEIPITQGKQRTTLGVPLMREDEPIGVLALARQRVEPFTERQIELVRTFADQAVIAIENARLLTETQEALEQQTATAEVLQVINASPGDLAPVFDAILEKAHSLCGAAHGALITYDGELCRALALHAMPEVLGTLLLQPFAPAGGGEGFQERLVQGERLVHIPDVTTIAAITPIQQAAIAAGIRTLLMVPLRKDDVLLGYITAHRREVCPFSDKQIALLQNFAAQAVIAMENARLITETRDALEQQTATAEVLQVINSSPGDLTPVFEAVLEKAHSLCGIAFGSLQLYERGKFRAVAVRGAPDSLAELLRQPIDPLPGAPPARLLGGERIVQVADYMAAYAEQQPSHPRAQATAEHGWRTTLYVPLRRDVGDAELLGYITAFRREVRLFSDKEIALLQNFAAQAVIAIENARLITETREALEQQTATAEVLQVINSSPGDLAPVFQAVLESALRLCGGGAGIVGHEAAA